MSELTLFTPNQAIIEIEEALYDVLIDKLSDYYPISVLGDIELYSDEEGERILGYRKGAGDDDKPVFSVGFEVSVFEFRLED